MTWIPGHRLVAILDRADVKLSEEERHLADDLRAGRQRFVSLDRADRILTRLDLSHFWHLPEAQGGLADIYEDGADYGGPDYAATVNLRPQVRMYGSEAERVEARRATWRRYYRRRTGQIEDAA